jgi:hypothetical protein
LPIERAASITETALCLPKNPANRIVFYLLDALSSGAVGQVHGLGTVLVAEGDLDIIEVDVAVQDTG